MSDPAPLELDANPAIDAKEADVVQLAEVLVGARKREVRFWATTTLGEAPPESATAGLRLVIARLLATGALRFLVEHGSGERALLRGGRRTRGHAFSADLVDVDDPAFARFSSLAFDWLWAVAHVALPLAERRATSTTTQPQQLTREERRALAAVRVRAAETAFDDVFCVLAYERLERLRLAEPIAAFLAATLRASSPLVRLLWPQDVTDVGVDGDAATAQALTSTPARVRVLELVQPLLVSSWAQAVRALWRAGEREAVVARAARVRGAIAAYVDAVSAIDRRDLCVPLAAFVLQVPALFPLDARERLVRLPGVVTMADRDIVVAALAAVVDLALVADALDVELHAARFGDERYEEAQLWKAGLERCGYRAGRDAVAACARRLSGAVG